MNTTKDTNTALEALRTALCVGHAADAVTIYAVKDDSILVEIDGTPFNLVLMPLEEGDLATVAELRPAARREQAALRRTGLPTSLKANPK
jgi:hypothetical protein